MTGDKGRTGGSRSDRNARSALRPAIASKYSGVK